MIPDKSKFWKISASFC